MHLWLGYASLQSSVAVTCITVCGECLILSDGLNPTVPLISNVGQLFHHRMDIFFRMIHLSSYRYPFYISSFKDLV